MTNSPTGPKSPRVRNLGPLIARGMRFNFDRRPSLPAWVMCPPWLIFFVSWFHGDDQPCNKNAGISYFYRFLCLGGPCSSLTGRGYARECDGARDRLSTLFHPRSLPVSLLGLGTWQQSNGWSSKTPIVTAFPSGLDNFD